MQKNQSAPKVSKPNRPMDKKPASEVICYRLKCAESGNGLSHYIMYGDLPQETVNE
jgi:hypothetical protein